MKEHRIHQLDEIVRRVTTGHVAFAVDDTAHVEFSLMGRFVEPKERPRFSRQGHAYTPKDTVEYEKAVREAAKKRMDELGLAPMEETVEVKLLIMEKPPSKAPEWEQQLAFAGIFPFPISGDIDNKAKAVLDGCNKVVYRDDSQIASLHLKRIFYPKPGFQMHVRQTGLTRDDIAYIRKAVAHKQK